MSNVIISNVQRKHASLNTVYHARYRHYFRGISRKDLPLIYGKALSTICEWISQYEKHGYFTRKQRNQVYKKIGSIMRQWVIDQYWKEPVHYLEEVKHKFQLHFHQNLFCERITISGMYAISCSSTRQLSTIETCFETRDMALLDRKLFTDENSVENLGYTLEVEFPT